MEYLHGPADEDDHQEQEQEQEQEAAPEQNMNTTTPPPATTTNPPPHHPPAPPCPPPGVAASTPTTNDDPPPTTAPPPTTNDDNQEQEEGRREEERHDNNTNDHLFPNKDNPESIQNYLARLLANSNELSNADTVAALWLSLYVLPPDFNPNSSYCRHDGNHDNALLPPPADNDNHHDHDGDDDDAAINDFDGRIETELQAIETVDQMTTLSCKAAQNLLTLNVHHDYCAKKYTTSVKNDLVLWLQKPNSFRNYFFYKVAGLRALLDKRNISTVAGGGGARSISKEDRIGALAGTLDAERVVVRNDEIIGDDHDNDGDHHEEGDPTRTRRTINEDELSSHDIIIKEILTKSFLPHQKGGIRDHCNHGHRLEQPILKKWIKAAHNDPEEVDDSCRFPTVDLKVRGAYTAGLAAKRGSVYVKDSIDFLVLVEEFDDPFLQPWGFECKGRTTSDTAADEEAFFSSLLGSKHIRISSDTVFEDIRLESERFQILHHANVYDLKTVVLAISDG